MKKILVLSVVFLLLAFGFPVAKNDFSGTLDKVSLIIDCNPFLGVAAGTSAIDDRDILPAPERTKSVASSEGDFLRYEKYKKELQEYSSRIAQEEALKPGFFEKLALYPFEYVGNLTTWHLDAVSWATWGLLFSGAALVLFPPATSAGVALIAGGTTIIAPTAIMKTTALLFGKYGLFNSMRLTFFYRSFQDGISRTDIYGESLPRNVLLDNAWNVSWLQGAIEYLKFEILAMTFPPQWRLISLFMAAHSVPARKITSSVWNSIFKKTTLTGFAISAVMVSEFAQSGIWEFWHRSLRFDSIQRFVENNTLWEDLQGRIPEVKEVFFSFFLLMALGLGGNIYYLLRQKETVSASKKGNTINSFRDICERGSKQELKKAIKAGAEINIRDTNGKSPLLWAAEKNLDAGVISLLIESGANISVRGEDGSSALMLAAKFNDNPDVISLLVEAGVDLNSHDKNGLTALMLAAKYSYSSEVVLALLKAGADPLSKDPNEQTALDLIKGNEAIKDSEAYWKLHDASFG